VIVARGEVKPKRMRREKRGVGGAIVDERGILKGFKAIKAKTQIII